MSVATKLTTSEAPKLLLDTNVYLYLANGRLAHAEARLLKLAAHRSPPLLWACPIIFDELVCRIRPDDQADFEWHRCALRWMEELCGQEGMAEDQRWVICRGVHTQAGPYDGKLAAVLIDVRRAIISAPSFASLPGDMRSAIDALRADYVLRIDGWVARRTKTAEAARVPPKPGEPGVKGSVVAANAVLAISRKHVTTYGPNWGAFRSDADQKRAQREQIALETAFLDLARKRTPYNHDNHRSDYNDYWLCAYCAADYKLVTTDARLRNTIANAGCSDPRLVSIDEGIALAESWLAGR